MLRAVLADLHIDEVLAAVAAELFIPIDEDVRPRAEAFIAALLDTATRPHEKAAAHVLAALNAERSLEPLVAEQHLKIAYDADPAAMVIDRLAWYASDRGDAVRAARLWRELEHTPGLDQDLRQVERFAKPAHAQLGRNEPCWCGSGRKFKQCHLGSTDLPALADRVGWLCRKAVAYLERCGEAEARGDVIDIAYARATDPDDADAVAAAFEDPIVMDLVLTECGWFERFLAERGELLPDDEALLARSWLLVDRTVYEVTDIRPGNGVEVRDLRTGERLEVRERTFSRETRVGTLVCARAVPDGETHQFIGSVFPVQPGREIDLLDVLDEGDPETIAAWVGGLHRPPTLVTREGEVSVQCELVVDAGDPDGARAFLDATYEREEMANPAEWFEWLAIGADERILRARLTLDGSRIVVSTTSEERTERVLTAIRASFPDAKVIADERTPIDMRAIAKLAKAQPGPFPVNDAFETPEMAAVLEELADKYERQWCDESIPALGGRTPREAAADPTRRGELERLIASFEGPIGPNAITMRPDRLRELLDL